MSNVDVNPCLFKHVSKTWQPFTHDSESSFQQERVSQKGQLTSFIYQSPVIWPRRILP